MDIMIEFYYLAGPCDALAGQLWSIKGIPSYSEEGKAINIVLKECRKAL